MDKMQSTNTEFENDSQTMKEKRGVFFYWYSVLYPG